MRAKIALAATSVAALLALTACGANTGGEAAPSSAASLDPANPTVVTVGASPFPHAEILEFIDDNLAQKAGIDLEIKQIDDYQIPNQALADGEIDANFFQHQPFFDDQAKTKGYKMEHGEGVHIEPFTAFSKKYKNADEVPEGAKVVINNDPANQIRGLKLLEDAGLLQNIADEDTVLTVNTDESKNPKKLDFFEVKAEQAPQLYKSDNTVAIALINGNFILQAKLPKEEVFQQESVENNPYANFLTWREGEETPAIAKLDELLHSDEVRDYIEENYPDGNVIPAF
ncbi:MetQ/NlpA family ABC transporter substrate-binding protein [Glutamicibacter sp. PS]|uniref:MetQ/NlpA family ABC transporter substrate-binding protein n=1 Tax=Glutamicibacter sp. PS TaxID=3075634 RepID=UPI00283FBA94|nr:MetQ/NlpA family ABC transporter substrate-binding protein [Glutamicibacter sp. PS]MDR4532350.1 MetQ/NlpA family ABC transporter substrate-binding protein [Glutamicibacter sp. PS]